MRLPQGFLGTRGDILMDAVLVAIVLTPFFFLWAVRLARTGRYKAHRNLQTCLLTVLLAAVVLFEVDIRLSGGTAAFLKGSPYAGTSLLTWLLRTHVVVAVLSFALWASLVVLAWKHRMDLHPHLFSATHRRRGYWVFAGTIFTSLSGCWLYVIGFVA
jgi:putative membrane protein